MFFAAPWLLNNDKAGDDDDGGDGDLLGSSFDVLWISWELNVFPLDSD